MSSSVSSNTDAQRKLWILLPLLCVFNKICAWNSIPVTLTWWCLLPHDVCVYLHALYYLYHPGMCWSTFSTVFGSKSQYVSAIIWVDSIKLWKKWQTSSKYDCILKVKNYLSLNLQPLVGPLCCIFKNEYKTVCRKNPCVIINYSCLLQIQLCALMSDSCKDTK